MLAYVLALAVGLGSLAIYLSAFFFPEIHRKNDFIWSGVGFFYALVLWVFARRISGGLLLGHVASVTLLGWSVSQTLLLRRQLTPLAQQTPIPSAETASNVSLLERGYRLQKGLGNAFNGIKNKFQQKPKQQPTTTTSVPKDTPVVEIVDRRTSSPEPAVEPTSTNTVLQTDTVIVEAPEDFPITEIVEAEKMDTAIEETQPPIASVEVPNAETTPKTPLPEEKPPETPTDL
jgi:Ycf66 protein N-terminus